MFDHVLIHNAARARSWGLGGCKVCVICLHLSARLGSCFFKQIDLLDKNEAYAQASKQINQYIQLASSISSKSASIFNLLQAYQANHSQFDKLASSKSICFELLEEFLQKFELLEKVRTFGGISSKVQKK